MADVRDDRAATAIIFPTCIDGEEGILVACCTKTSNILRRCHNCIDGSIILKVPAWLLFQCYFFAGMSILNWSEITDPAYAALCEPLGVFGDFLNAQCLKHCISYTDYNLTYDYLTPANRILRVSANCSVVSEFKYGLNFPAVAAWLYMVPYTSPCVCLPVRT